MKSCLSCRTLLLAILSLATVRETQAQLLIDTGEGEASGGDGLYSFPDNGGFQWLAGQFTLSQDITLTAAQGWVGSWDHVPGTVNMAITTDAAGLPGTPLFTDTFVYPAANLAQWAGVTDVNLPLAAGTYWITFAPQEGTVAYMPYGVPHPLNKYAAWNPYNSESWVEIYGAGALIGFRVYGDPVLTPVPEPAVCGFAAAGGLGLLVIWRLRRAPSSTT